MRYESKTSRGNVGVSCASRAAADEQAAPQAERHEPSVSTKLKACAALLLKGEAFGLVDAAAQLGWVGLHAVASSWVGHEESRAVWLASSREELATFLLFIAAAEAR